MKEAAVGPRPLIASIVLLLAATSTALAGQKAAIFPLELIDASIEGELAGPRGDETQRLVLATRELRMLAARDVGYEVVDLAAFSVEIEKAAPLHRCGGCEIDLARRAGADLAITGAVRKVSNLILGFTIEVREVASGTVLRVVQASIRGNTDESWLRGIRWLVANRLVAPP
jgi:hypothetical protein